MPDEQSNSMPKKYTFHRDGVPEKVNREEWRWEATYTDGSVIKQFDDNTGLFHQIGEIDQSRLHSLKMVHDELPSVVLLFEPEMKLIHKYRRIVLENGQQRMTFYIIGYKKGGEFRYLVLTPQEVIWTSDPDQLSVM